MAKVHLFSGHGLEFWGFYCPGCKYDHGFHTKPHKNHAGRPGPVWTFNGDVDKPTFSPSLLVNGSTPEKRCHLFLRDGKIQYCSDSYHELAGKTVECPDWED